MLQPTAIAPAAPTAVATAVATVTAATAQVRPVGSVVRDNLPLLLSGLLVTLQLAAMGLALALVLGTVGALLRTAPLWPLQAVGTAYVEFIRNTPLLVQIFFVYVGLPAIGLRFPPFTAAVMALGIYTGAYVTEAIRAGILSVGRGQLEAARSLGLSYGQMMRYVVLPQAITITVPPLGNLTIALFMNTSLANAIAVPELLYRAQLVNSRTFATYEIFAFAALCYLTFSLPMGGLVNLLERRLTRYR
ncbi:MAG TPA: amino acid ABC transporter permease [Chloroflexota bacterium]|nr:amino acid ABC transporter permease [Chloroflexota bacterium]